MPTPMSNRSINQKIRLSSNARPRIEPQHKKSESHINVPEPKILVSCGTKGDTNKKASAGTAPISPIISAPTFCRSSDRDTSGIDRLKERPIAVTAAIIVNMGLFLSIMVPLVRDPADEGFAVPVGEYGDHVIFICGCCKPFLQFMQYKLGDVY